MRGRSRSGDRAKSAPHSPLQHNISLHVTSLRIYPVVRIELSAVYSVSSYSFTVHALALSLV